MNRNILIAIGALILALSGGGLFIATQQLSTTEDAKMAEEKTAMIKDEEVIEKDDSVMKVDSRYMVYSKSVLDNSSDKRRVLFFYASWCPTCRPADENIKNNTDRIPEDMTIIRVNYNDPDTDQEEKDLAEKYNITYQHTFVQIDSNGTEIAKWNGGNLDQILTNIK